MCVDEHMAEFQALQIAASECLRQGCDLNLERDERLILFEQSAEFAAKAFLAARENVYFRYLAVSQFECAQGMKLMLETGFNSKVLTAQDADEYQMLKKYADGRGLASN